MLQTIFRDELINYLKERKIGTIIHYPVPPHLAEAYIGLGYQKGDFPITERLADTVLSIPVYNGMTEKEIDYIWLRLLPFLVSVPPNVSVLPGAILPAVHPDVN